MKRTLTLALILSLAAVLAPSLTAQDKAPDNTIFLGDWEGTVDIGGQQLAIAVHFKLDDKKALTGTLDSLDQAAMDLPLSGFKIEARTITFTIDSVPGEPVLKLTVDETGRKMAGPLTQNGIEGAIQLAKKDKARP